MGLPSKCNSHTVQLLQERGHGLLFILLQYVDRVFGDLSVSVSFYQAYNIYLAAQIFWLGMFDRDADEGWILPVPRCYDFWKT